MKAQFSSRWLNSASSSQYLFVFLAYQPIEIFPTFRVMNPVPGLPV
jgi:hypothetical protein